MQQLSSSSECSVVTVCLASSEQGFSLVELMAVLAILSTLLLVAAPSFVDTIKNSRMRTESYAIRSSLANARSEAMTRRAPVIVCKTTDLATCDTDNDPWSTAHLAFVDDNNDGAVDSGELFLVREHNDSVEVVFRAFTGSPANRVRFSSRGDSLGSSGTFTVCDDRGAAAAKAVILNNAGDVRFAIDSDDPEDDIVNDIGGNNVGC